MLPEIDLATRTQTVVIEIDRSQSPEVVPGQVVQTSITQQVDKQGFLLPTAALLPGVRGLWSVYAVIQDNGQDVIQRRHVEVLHTSGDQVLVQGTVAEGDRVVISGVQRLVSGQRVRVVK
jgi:multidrug efflux pump subunit AcrA (membrane-fusion protein)